MKTSPPSKSISALGLGLIAHTSLEICDNGFSTHFDMCAWFFPFAWFLFRLNFVIRQ